MIKKYVPSSRSVEDHRLLKYQDMVDDKITCGVLIATHNGGSYLREQIHSINKTGILNLPT